MQNCNLIFTLRCEKGKEINQKIKKKIIKEHRNTGKDEGSLTHFCAIILCYLGGGGQTTRGPFHKYWTLKNTNAELAEHSPCWGFIFLTLKVTKIKQTKKQYTNTKLAGHSPYWTLEGNGGWQCAAITLKNCPHHHIHCHR